MKQLLRRIHNWWLVKRGKRHPQADELIAFAQWYYSTRSNSPYDPMSDWGSK